MLFAPRVFLMFFFISQRPGITAQQPPSSLYPLGHRFSLVLNLLPQASLVTFSETHTDRKYEVYTHSETATYAQIIEVHVEYQFVENAFFCKTCQKGSNETNRSRGRGMWPAARIWVRNQVRPVFFRFPHGSRPLGAVPQIKTCSTSKMIRFHKKNIEIDKKFAELQIILVGSMKSLLSEMVGTQGGLGYGLFYPISPDAQNPHRVCATQLK